MLKWERFYDGRRCDVAGLRFVSRLWWAADMGVVEVAGCRFEFRRILFWENVEGWEGVVCGVRKRWTGGDFGFRGAGGSWYGTIFLYVSACACALCARACARARGKTFEVDPRLFSCGSEKFGLSDDGLPFASWPFFLSVLVLVYWRCGSGTLGPLDRDGCYRSILWLELPKCGPELAKS
jgi:hypothetical protein